MPNYKITYFFAMNRNTTIQTIHKRLCAIGCPFSEEPDLLSKSKSKYSLLEKQVIVNIVAWIEDQCIRL